MNFDNRSMALNDESPLMVLDGTIGQHLNQMFLDDSAIRRRSPLWSVVNDRGLNESLSVWQT